MEVKLQLAGQPSRLGLTWREDTAEPSSVTVVRVVPHSPAQLAGLQVNDRIYEVDGQTFRDRGEFLEMVDSADFPIEFAIERSGRPNRITLMAIE
jgi:C-terminal processing protease CtpA/Prc